MRNALAGIAVAYQMGIPITISAKAFEHFEGQRQRLIHMENRYTILDDTYNASPDSMKASIDVLCDMDCEGKRSQYWEICLSWELTVPAITIRSENTCGTRRSMRLW